MAATTDASPDGLGGDPDAVIRQLYSVHARALHDYVARFCPDRATADDIVQETFIRAWRHLPRLSADGRPIRPWLFRVARNLLTDANRAERARPVTVPEQPAGAGPWPRSPASSASRTAQPDHGCTTRSMHCASNSKNKTQSRADEQPPALGPRPHADGSKTAPAARTQAVQRWAGWGATRCPAG